VIDMTHIDNLIAALILAAKCGESGAVCTITNDEPVRLWSLLRDVLRQLNVPAPRRRIPRSVAMTAASLLVWQHRVLRHSGEPVLTRYTAGLLSRTQTFDISAARRTLNYAPHVSMTEGVQRTLNAMTARDERDAPVAVRLRLFSTGFTAHRAHLAESGADRNLKIRFHAMFGLIEHPTEGLTLFDTGYAPRFFQATERLPYKLYRWTTPVSTCSDLAAVSVLRQHGINLSDVRRIVLSHFHADHVCGLLDFPNAEIITSARAWLSVQGKKGFAAVKRAILPDLFPADLHKRLRLIEHFHGPGFGPFESTHDLFGDGSVRMVNLSGHALGQIGLLLQRTPEEMDGDGKQNGAGSLRCLLAADSVWTSRTFRENLPATLGFRLLAASPREARESQQVLHDFHRQFPHIEIIPTHCPEVASRYAFDLEVDRLLAEAKSHSSAGHCS
jgi:glyoxylase-like metal-dependent hydrolase (beta-lactamase superfamily II)